MFYLKIRPLAAKNVLLIHLAPGAKKCFIDRLCRWRQKGYKRVTPPGSFIFADLTPEGSHVSSHLVPGGNIFSLYHLVPGGIIFFTIWSLAESFFLPFGPWRHHFFTIWSLAESFFLSFCPWRQHFLIYPFEKMASIVFNFKIS